VLMRSSSVFHSQEDGPAEHTRFLSPTIRRLKVLKDHFEGSRFVL
jgi:hypothetical protein